jgi:hypothetical protein
MSQKIEPEVFIFTTSIFIFNRTLQFYSWVVSEKIHTPSTEEISAVRKTRREKFVVDNSKCVRTSEGGRGTVIDFQFPLWEWYTMFSGMTQY